MLLYNVLMLTMDQATMCHVGPSSLSEEELGDRLIRYFYIEKKLISKLHYWSVQKMQRMLAIYCARRR